MRSVLNILLCLCWAIAVSGQTPFYNDNKTAKDTLEVVPELIYWDTTGSFWIGTSEGYFLFDGIEKQISTCLLDGINLQTGKLYGADSWPEGIVHPVLTNINSPRWPGSTQANNKTQPDESIPNSNLQTESPFWKQWWFYASWVAVLTFLFFLYQKNRDRRMQIINLMEKDKAENKLAILKAQVNPHFLFNSFNTLVSVVEKTPENAAEYIENLSDFYRKIMQMRDRDVISLEEEILLLKNYFYIIKKRYGNNIDLHIDLPEKETFIVPLTLQLLVENAVKHNVISKRKPLSIQIEAEGTEYISVQNNFQPKMTSEESSYFGLQSLVQRYKYLNKMKVKVKNDNKYFKVSIPVIN